ncbi:ATPase [Aureimonas endophytica]|uniref:ATPase n=1 Tax=Aureimonas endophytica TaxID=2027858 RepID=A0A917A140_9HYPH|nr:AAA family ATPase [Aureimonas endophytica]GGE22048.1 ATPase [Aureimonas endophytica]
MNRFVMISGCSGGGKSTLLAELAGRGFAVVEEPGRRVVAEERARSGTALPWIDMAAFARRALDLARGDYEAARHREGTVFFDRGLVDAAVALGHATGEAWPAWLRDRCRYHRRVFLTPPWPEIYAGDAERRHDLPAAIAEYERLLAAYPALAYEITILPKTSVAARAETILAALDAA